MYSRVRCQQKHSQPPWKVIQHSTNKNNILFNNIVIIAILWLRDCKTTAYFATKNTECKTKSSVTSIDEVCQLQKESWQDFQTSVLSLFSLKSKFESGESFSCLISLNITHYISELTEKLQIGL